MKTDNYFTNEFSYEVWDTTYRAANETTIEDTWSRVAKAIAGVEVDKKQKLWENKFFELLKNFKFIPGGRILANAGRNVNATLINCFVSPRPDCDIDSLDGIMTILTDQAKTLKSEGGWGLNFSFIRPRGSYIKGIGVRTPGAVKYMELFNKSSEIITEGPGIYELEFEDNHSEEKKKIRKGAMMSMLSIYHPDIEEFIRAKQTSGRLTKMNMSVAMSDMFMNLISKIDDLIKSGASKEEIERLDKWQLIFPDTTFENYKTEWDGNFERWLAKGYPVNVYRTVKATDIWNLIMSSTYNRAEPGIMFIDRANKTFAANYIDGLYIDCTNPCLTGDTKVAVADGRTTVTIKELADAGKDIPVLACDNDGNIITKMMRHPRITGYNKDIYRVTLDDGNHIDCTSNHKFRLSDGTYKEVKDMIPGESLYVASISQHKFSEIFDKSNNNSQLYSWVKTPNKKSRRGLHRINAEYIIGRKLTKDEVVHHKDHNGLNNDLSNLEVMTKAEHDALHTLNMIGDKNPMRRAAKEWSKEKWNDYKAKQSKASSGERNRNFKGVTNELLLEIAKNLIVKYKRFFTLSELQEELLARNLYPLKGFGDKYRQEFFGGSGITAICKYAAKELGIYSDIMNYDVRIQQTFIDALEQGYEAIIDTNKQVLVKKICEECKTEFFVPYNRREVSFCSSKCSNANLQVKAKISESVSKALTTKYSEIKANTRLNQLKIYTDLKFQLQRDPFKLEFIEQCKQNGIPARFGPHSPFRTYAELKKQSLDYNHRVVSIEYIGKQDVYTGTVDDVHNYCVGMFETVNEDGHSKFYMLNNMQCGEQALPKAGCCNLGSINLTQYIRAGEFALDAFKEDIATAVRFLDNVLDIANLPLDTYNQFAKNYRRIGLGIMGLGSALMMLGIKYGSEESIEWIHNILNIYNKVAIKTSIDLGVEKGSYKDFDTDKHLKNILRFYPNMSTEDMDEIGTYLCNKNAMRHTALFSIQPTGNTGCLANNVSGGVEPVFSLGYVRTANVPVIPEHIKDKCPAFWEGNISPNEFFKQAGTDKDPYLEYIDEYNDTYIITKDRGLCKRQAINDYARDFLVDESADYVVLANELTVDEHLAVLEACAKHVDSAISKTINVKNDYPFEAFKDIYLKAYKGGYVKGVTTYRDGSMIGVLSTNETKDNKDCPCMHKSVAVKRPKELDCKLHLLNIKGVSYYVIVGFLGEDPYEVFMGENLEDIIDDDDGEVVGHKVIFKSSMNNIEGKMIKKANKQYVFTSEDFTYYISRKDESDEKATITSYSRILSCALKHGTPIKSLVEQMEKTSGSFAAPLKVITRVLKKYIKDGEEVQGEVCPECGGKLVRKEGCKSCVNCGWSACG